MAYSIRTQYVNATLGKPTNWDESLGHCRNLPVCVTDDPIVYSWWRLSWRERLAVLFGKPIRLSVVGRTHAPVAIGADWSAIALPADPAAKEAP